MTTSVERLSLPLSGVKVLLGDLVSLEIGRWFEQIIGKRDCEMCTLSWRTSQTHCSAVSDCSECMYRRRYRRSGQLQLASIHENPRKAILFEDSALSTTSVAAINLSQLLVDSSLGVDF